MLRGGNLPRTEIALIVEIHSVSDGLKSAGARKSLYHGEELVLAVKASRRIIPDVFRPVEFFGANDLQRDVMFASESDSVFKLKPRQAWRIGDNGQHVASEFLMTSPGEECGVCAAGVGDQRAAQRAKVLVQSGTLYHQFGNKSHRDILRRHGRAGQAKGNPVVAKSAVPEILGGRHQFC